MDSNEPNWVDLCSMLATVATAIIAGLALYNWKEQRKYELRMEGLAKSRLALDLVKKLRTYTNNKENYSQYLIESADYFEVLLKEERDLHEDILRLKEMLWAAFGERNNNTMFYSQVTDVIDKIRDSRLQLWLEEFHKEIDQSEKVESLSIMAFHQGENDPVMLNLEKLQKLIIRR